MTLHAPYDPGNIFAQILRGTLPCIPVYEDDVALAFMDVFPQADGHVLVIPKQVEARTILDMPETHLGPYMQRVQTVARAVEKGLTPDGLVLTQFNGAPAGQTVFHLHVHIIPRWSDVPLGRHGDGKMATPDQLEPFTSRIRAALA